tara:strand:- start:638 stop:1624 length:987 start_codon:yes stop_codon:yes gene_type:complete
MPINTNFAPAESLIYKGWYVQQRRKKRNRLPVSITQVFINLESTAGAYYLLSAPWAASSDFELECDFATSTAAVQIIFGYSLGQTSFMTVEADGTLRVKISGVSVTSTETFADGSLHSLRVARVGAAVTAYVDGVVVLTASSGGTLTLDSIGQYVNDDPFNGILSNLKLTDITTPANSLEFELNNLAAETETNNGVTLTYKNIALDVRDTYTLVDGAWLGSELWTYGDYTYTGSETAFFTLLGSDDAGVVTIGADYVWSWTQGVVGTAQSRFKVGGNSDGQSVSGSFSGVESAATDTQLRYQAGPNPELSAGTTLTNASVKRKIEVAS